MYNVYPDTEHSEEKRDAIVILIELFDTDIISILIQIVSGTVYDTNSLFFYTIFFTDIIRNLISYIMQVLFVKYLIQKIIQYIL